MGPSVEVSRDPGGIARQVVRGSAYSVAASLVTMALGFLRILLLLRFLGPEAFGVIGMAGVYAAAALQLVDWGLDQGVLHRQARDRPTLATYGWLRMGTVATAALALFLAAPILGALYPRMPELPAVLRGLSLVVLLQGLSFVQETMMSRDMRFDRRALVDVAAAATMTVVAPYLAWRGWGVWALVAEQASGIGVRALLTWGPLRMWRPHRGWDPEIARWFVRFGRPLWLSGNIQFLLERFDDFWVGTVLGQEALGLYARAFEFAQYPRRVVAGPLVLVLTPAFARLQGDRRRLSQAFYRGAYVLLRASLLLSGVMAIALPELLQLLNPRWLPMVRTFRLMLVYAMLEGWVALAGGLLVATGHPAAMGRVALARLAFFLPGVVVGAWAGGIDGVALAADGMMALSALMLYRPLRETVDFSIWPLMGGPLLAWASAGGIGLLIEALSVPSSPLARMLLKGMLFIGIYVGWLLAFEKGTWREAASWIRMIRQRSAGLLQRPPQHPD
jgi:O-antigen/teichoic acid export membrane protein